MAGISLRDGRKASISIGIHSGDVMCGVVGETKPQFSILGTNVDKAASICRKSKSNSIMISKQSYKIIVNKVNNFIFEEVDLLINNKLEVTYQVQKRRGMNKRLAY